MNNTTPEVGGMQIWVDVDVWNRLQLLSRPAESPNDFLRRAILDQVPDGFVTPRKAYLLPLLQALVELGGSAKADAVQDKMKEHMQCILAPIERYNRISWTVRS